MEFHFTNNFDDALAKCLELMRVVGMEGWASSYSIRKDSILIHATKRVGQQFLHRFLVVQIHQEGESHDSDTTSIPRK